MMPGGSADAYKHIQAIVEKVAAQVHPEELCFCPENSLHNQEEHTASAGHVLQENKLLTAQAAQLCSVCRWTMGRA